jgi:hypothetical protein
VPEIRNYYSEKCTEQGFAQVKDFSKTAENPVLGFAQVKDFSKTAENPVLGFAQVKDFSKTIEPADVAIWTLKLWAEAGLPRLI